MATGRRRRRAGRGCTSRRRSTGSLCRAHRRPNSLSPAAGAPRGEGVCMACGVWRVDRHIDWVASRGVDAPRKRREARADWCTYTRVSFTWNCSLVVRCERSVRGVESLCNILCSYRSCWCVALYKYMNTHKYSNCNIKKVPHQNTTLFYECSPADQTMLKFLKFWLVV